MSVAVSLTLSIVNTSNRELLRDCLQSIRDTVRQTSHEVIVVDNASDDGSTDMVEREFPTCRLIRLTQREGYGASHNHAIAVAAGKYVLILNEDMEMLPGAIDTMVAKAEAIPDLGVLGCRILNADRSLQHSCFRFPYVGQELFEALFPYTLMLQTAAYARRCTSGATTRRAMSMSWSAAACWRRVTSSNRSVASIRRSSSTARSTTCASA